MSTAYRFLWLAGFVIGGLVIARGWHACRRHRQAGSIQQPLDNDTPDRRSEVATTRNQVIFDQANHPDWPQITDEEIEAAWAEIEADLGRFKPWRRP